MNPKDDDAQMEEEAVVQKEITMTPEEQEAIL
jgi:hypothetical protein